MVSPRSTPSSCRRRAGPRPRRATQRQERPHRTGRPRDRSHLASHSVTSPLPTGKVPGWFRSRESAGTTLSRWHRTEARRELSTVFDADPAIGQWRGLSAPRRRRAADEPRRVPLVPRGAGVVGGHQHPRRAGRGRCCSGRTRPRAAGVHPVAEPVGHRRRRAPGRHGRSPPGVVLAHGHLAGRGHRPDRGVPDPFPGLAVAHPDPPAADPAARELPHPLRPVPDDGRLADPLRTSRATPTGASSSTTCAARPRPRRRCARSSPSGSPARPSSRPAASASAACSSSARPAPARRCSPRRSPPASTRPFVTIPGSGLRPDLHRHGRDHRPAASPARRSASRASGAASASSSSTRSTPSACAASALGPGMGGAAMPHGDRHPRPLLLRRQRRAHADRRPDPRDRARGASGCSPMRATGAVRASAVTLRTADAVIAHLPRRHGRRWRSAGAEPAARRDGRHRQPALLAQASLTNRLNTLLDALYFVPHTHRQGAAAAAGRPKPTRQADLLHRRDCNVPLAARSTPRSRGRAAWAATSGSARRPRTTAWTSSTCTSARSTHEPDLDRPKRRDELARITNGYSPAMIEQVCSMALTDRAPRRPRARSAGDDIVEAMTTVESGTAVNVDYVPDETRADRDPRGGPRGRRRTCT